MHIFFFFLYASTPVYNVTPDAFFISSSILSFSSLYVPIHTIYTIEVFKNENNINMLSMLSQQYVYID